MEQEFACKFTDAELDLIECTLYKMSLEDGRNDYEQIEQLREKIASLEIPEA